MSYEDLLRMLRGPYPTLMMDGCTKISPHVLAEAHDAIAKLQAELARKDAALWGAAELLKYLDTPEGQPEAKAALVTVRAALEPRKEGGE